MGYDYQRLPPLGSGLGYRDPYRADVFRHHDQIDFLEIVADHFFDPKPGTRQLLDLLLAHFPLIPHGLGLSLGSADGLDREYLRRFQQVIEVVDPPWWSEHISFTRASGIDIGHLTPLPKTRETLDVLHQNIGIAQSQIGRPLILENITETISYQDNSYDDASFLGAILDENDCGLLLDVTNLYINSINYRFDPLRVLERLPRDRIVQLHFVGAYWEGETLVDGHSDATSPEIWQLLEEVVKYATVKGILLERDEKLPPFPELLDEVQRARRIWTDHGRTDPYVNAGQSNP